MNLTVRDVSGLLQVSERTVYRWIGQGILPVHRVNGQHRFNRAELLEWATARRIKVAAELFDEPESTAGPLPGLAESLQAGGIVYGVGGTDKESVLRAMVQHVPVPEEVDREFLLHVLLAREKLQSTGIGDGIAIPHVRNPIVLQVARPLITLCFLAQPVDFAALDGKPVHALFSLICPTVRAHLRLLARLSFALQDERFRGVIARQAPPEQVLAEAGRVEQALEQQHRVRDGSQHLSLLLIALAVLLGSAALALVAPTARWVSRLGAAGAVAACALGIVPALRVAAGAPSEALRLGWAVPYGAFSVQIDALSAFFLVPILGLAAAAAVYGAGYLAPERAPRRLRAAWVFFNLLVASMVLVVLARNAVLFLVGWELMALASFFLVTLEDEQASARKAGWMYLVAMHLGTACLSVLFVLLGRASASLDFDRFAATSAPAGFLFVLALLGFGTKAGFMPLHVWLPEAHPAAPSHVSALMSGVMIKTGIYGLVRVLLVLGPPPAWWGWLLCGVGLTSGIFGVLFALAQHDLKRLLAYHSVENIGIIALGLGVGELGLSSGSLSLTVLGFSGALLHVVNHAIFKSLLFFGAGAVAHATGTREIDHLGGLLKRMPWTGVAFLIGAVAISGLPPLNGFVSEFLIFLAALRGVISADATAAVPLLAVIAGLALIGGLAAACFTKAFGIVFLGEPRSARATLAHEPGLAMQAPMLVLAAGCVVIGWLAPRLVGALQPVVASATGLAPEAVREAMDVASAPLSAIGAAAVGLLVLVALLAWVRRWLLAGRQVDQRVTWDCGYARPSARMQYTAASFAQPLTELFAPLLQSRRHLVPPAGPFPREAALSTDTPDVCTERLYAPLFAALGRGLAALRWLQHGQVQLYVLYIALTLLLLLVWKLG